MLKIIPGYLNHVQNSVFEGEPTDAQRVELEDKMRDLRSEDSIIIYREHNKRWSNSEVRGVEKYSTDNFV